MRGCRKRIIRQFATSAEKRQKRHVTCEMTRFGAFCRFSASPVPSPTSLFRALFVPTRLELYHATVGTHFVAFSCGIRAILPFFTRPVFQPISFLVSAVLTACNHGIHYIQGQSGERERSGRRKKKFDHLLKATKSDTKRRNASFRT